MEHLMDYWRDQEDAVLSVGQKKHLAGLHTYADEYDLYDDKAIKDYESTAKDLHDQQDRESEEYERRRNGSIDTPSPLNRHSREACPRPRSGNGNPEARDNASTDSDPRPVIPAQAGIQKSATRMLTPSAPTLSKTSTTNP